MKNKEVRKVSNRKVSDKETLHKQMELLAERSKSATERELADLTAAMCETHRTLSHPLAAAVASACLAAMTANLIASVAVHIVKRFR